MYIIPIAIVLIVILLQNRKPSPNEMNLSYAQFQIDREDNLKKMRQEMDDRQLVRDAKAEALDMFEQWVRGDIIVIRKPIIKFILNHCPYTSKYTSDDLEQIRKTEFQRLKNEYEAKYGTHRNGGLFDYRKWQRRVSETNPGITGGYSGLQTAQTDSVS